MTDIVSVIIAGCGVLLIPLLGLIVRVVTKMTRMDDRLGEAVKDLAALVKDKDRVHAELYQQMREDRAATNIRLRWLEEHAWGRRGDPES